jgi:hypothetical protein
MHKQMPSARDTHAPSGRRPALRYAFVAAVVVAAPMFLPTVATAAEPVGRTVVGELVQAWPEAQHAAEAGHGDSAEQPLTWIETEDGDAVRVRTEDVADLPVGATVEVTVGDELADDVTDRSDPAHEVLGSELLTAPEVPAAPTRRLTNEVTVALVAPAGAAPDAVTVDQLVTAVDGPAARFWAEQSGGTISLGVTAAHGWTTTAAGCGDPTALWNETAAAIGFAPGAGKHLLLYVSDAAAGCLYGLAQVGSAPSSGGRSYVTDVLPSLIAHEIGHNFGLGHSSALYCDGGLETGGCDTAPYRDHYDVMGASWEQIGSLNVVQAARLGVLAPAAVHTLSSTDAGGRVTLGALSGGGGVRALRLLDAGGGEYWLELRTASGQDAWLAGRENRFDLEAGVLVRRSGPWPDASLLLDPTPVAGRSGDLQAALPVGGTVTLAGGAFEITVSGMTATGAMVEVRTASAVPAVTEPASPAGSTPTSADTVLPAGSCVGCATSPPASPETGFGPTETTAPAAPVEAGTASIAAADPQPAVATASSSTSFAVPAAGAALGCAAFVLVRRRIRR